DADMLRLDREVVQLSGDQIHLPLELRHPEAVDHILARELQLYRFPDRDVDLVRRGETLLWVLHLPPPLMPDHLDLEPRIRILCRERGQRPEREEKQDD